MTSQPIEAILKIVGSWKIINQLEFWVEKKEVRVGSRVGEQFNVTDI